VLQFVGQETNLRTGFTAVKSLRWTRCFAQSSMLSSWKCSPFSNKGTPIFTLHWVPYISSEVLLDVPCHILQSWHSANHSLLVRSPGLCLIIWVNKRQTQRRTWDLSPLSKWGLNSLSKHLCSHQWMST
jgi:hypothetical protein